MTIDDASDDRSARATQPEGVGAFLRARREALGLSYADVAAVVKLPAKRVEALEAERWSELPDGPFLRGFLRNVARALDLDAASLMDRVDDSLMRERNPESILVAPGAARGTLPRRSGPLEERHGGRMLVYGAFLFALVAALIAWSGTESFERTLAKGRSLVQSSSSPVAPSASAPETKSEPLPTPGSTVAASDAPTTAPNPADALPVPASPAPATAADATPASASPLALLLHFTQDCWVEVRSADGRILVSGTIAAGSDRTVEGEAPYSVILGNAKGVDLRYRGQPVDLGPYTRDQVARLTLS